MSARIDRGVDVVPERTAAWILRDRIAIPASVMPTLLALAAGYLLTPLGGPHIFLMIPAVILVLAAAVGILLDARRLLLPRWHASGLGYMLASVALTAGAAWCALMTSSLGSEIAIMGIMQVGPALLCLYGWRRVTLAPDIVTDAAPDAGEEG